jgi:hypothetical protein
MRDGGAWQKKTEIKEEPAATAEPFSPAQALESETSDPTTEDVLLNIDELRPGDLKVLSEREFNLLRSTLLEGFTRAQLEAYITKFRNTSQREKVRVSGDTPWVLELWDWRPEVEVGHGSEDPALAGYVTKSMTPKERTGVRLIRECWGLSTQELLDGQGYLDARIRDPEFSLLLGASLPPC